MLALPCLCLADGDLPTGSRSGLYEVSGPVTVVDGDTPKMGSCQLAQGRQCRTITGLPHQGQHLASRGAHLPCAVVTLVCTYTHR